MPPARTGPPVEQYIAGGNFKPVAQDWLRAHPEYIPPEFGGNAEKNAAMMEGHYAATRQRLALNSPEYFRVIEEHIGERTPVSVAADTKKAGDGGAVQEQQRQQTQQRKPLPSAPPSRDQAVSGAPRGKRSVKLNADQQEAAKISFPHLTDKEAFSQYATNLVALEAEGKMGRTSH